MTGLEESTINCPYCGEDINILIDCSESEQQYIEDCQVCCRPINFDISINGSAISIRAFDENE